MTDFIVSARKYRPKTFDAMVGQSIITSTLKNAINKNQLAQSYLFCGPRGVGKTTCARIFAKEINKFDNDNDDFSFNIFELDAASNNSVDDIRNLTDQVRIPPQIGKYKVYIIDEVHMLSQSAFNAFLKTLEEPPNHAKFILATTEKQKIIPTILSRCQIFDFKRVGVADIATHLKYIANSEGIAVEMEALNLIAQKSDGAVRDSLSIFDRLVSFSEKNLTYKSVIDHLNILDYDYYFNITLSLLKNDTQNILNIFNEILDNGFEGNHFINGLAIHLRDLLVAKDKSTLELIEKSNEVKQRYIEQSSVCDLNFLIQALQLCNECDLSYRNTNNKRLLVELTLLQIASIEMLKSQKKNSKKFVVNSIFENKVIKEKESPHKSFKKQNESDDAKETFMVHDQKPQNIIRDLTTNELTSSIISIRNSLKVQDTSKIEKSSLKTREDNFSEEKLLKVWTDLTNHTRKNGKINLAVTLAANKPKILDNFVIELTVSNSTQKEMLLEESKTIQHFLSDNLKNDKIKLTAKVIELEKNDTIYTARDKFNKLLADNSNLETLKNNLGLDPEY